MTIDAKTKAIIVAISIPLGIIAILLLILLPFSFSYIDYDEYAFARRRTTGTVDTTRVYSGGRYLIGPDFEFKKFNAVGHFVKYKHIPIFTTDQLEVSITVELQYFLIKEDLALLHNAYDIYYDAIIVNNAKDALKNAVTKFDTDEFISNRSVIQKDLLDGVRQRLSGKCCLPNCKKDCATCRVWEKCDVNCKPRETCTKEDKGLFVEVRYLQLHDIDIPQQVNDKKLNFLLKNLEREKEESTKEETIVRKQTEFEIAKIKNNASELLAKSQAQAKYLISEAQVDYEKSIDTANNEGIKKLVSGLGITSSKHKASLNYLRALNENDRVKYSIDFNTLVSSTK